MASPFSNIPDEILLMIMEQVMLSSVPMELIAFTDYLYWSLCDGLRGYCNNPLSKWLSIAVDRPSCVRFLSNNQSICQFPQKDHLKDWIIANSISRRFRMWGKRAFFSSKSIVVQVNLWGYFVDKQPVLNFPDENRDLLLRHCCHIIGEPWEHWYDRDKAFHDMPFCQTYSHFHSLDIQNNCQKLYLIRDVDHFYYRSGEDAWINELPRESWGPWLKNVGLNTDHLRAYILRPLGMSERLIYN